MALVKEITVFTVGDANAVSTWSNVPYYFTKSLEEKNIRVNKVNIEENSILSAFYKYSVYIFLKLFYKNSSHTYFRSRLNYLLTHIKIKRYVKKHHTSEWFIFLTYSFSIPKIESKKIILFSDWSYLYQIRIFFKREPYWFERRALQREEKNINDADIVLSLFPGSKLFNTEHYKNKNAYYLGNVINSSFELSKTELTTLKLSSKKILFIGNKKYLEGALDLINAFKQLYRDDDSEIELHIIGLSAKDTGITCENLFQHGYLDKGKTDENKLYYKLISEARCIVNTTTNWGAFSAMTEAMYYCTPVITTAYNEFIQTYGSELNFGSYVPHNSPDELKQTLRTLLNCSPDNYVPMMEAAHEKVKEFTWENYSEKVLQLFSK